MLVRERIKSHKDHDKLHGLKVRTSKNVVGFIYSIGDHTVFLNNVSGEHKNGGQLYPQILMKDEDILNWEIASDTAPCNCDVLIQHRYIMND
jgi:hypothetical protein